jgi:hypothetical protein
MLSGLLFAILLSVMAIIIHSMMARSQVENQSEYRNPLDSHFNLTDAGTPDATIVLIANRLRAWSLVEDAAVSSQIRFSTDGSLRVRGILLQDQDILPTKPNQTLSTKKITYLEWGRGRVYTSEAIAKNVRFVAAAAGQIRAYNPAGGDTINMVLGRTKCACSAVGDICDVMFSPFFNGA